MKVLLFTQIGNARPKCVHPNVPERMSRRSGEAIRDVFRDPARLGLVRLAAVHGEWAAEVASADRWWLVECENADAGRWMIGWPMDKTTWPPPQGRILAQGGRP